MASFLKPKKIVLFPELKDVFVDVTKQHRNSFFPLATIPLSLVNKRWSGKVHLLYTNEDPYYEEAIKYYDDYSMLEQISFSWDENKYEFLSDLNYFNVSEKWEKWLNLSTEEYKRIKSDYHKTGNNGILDNLTFGGQPEWIQDDRTPYLDDEPMTFVAQIDTSDLIDDYCGRVIYLFFSSEHKMVVQITQFD